VLLDSGRVTETETESVDEYEGDTQRRKGGAIQAAEEAEAELNFHLFHYVMAGLDAQERASLGFPREAQLQGIVRGIDIAMGANRSANGIQNVDAGSSSDG